MGREENVLQTGNNMDKGIGTGLSLVGTGSKEWNSGTGRQDSLHGGVEEEVRQTGWLRL